VATKRTNHHREIGSAGGKARAAALPSSQRREIAAAGAAGRMRALLARCNDEELVVFSRRRIATLLLKAEPTSEKQAETLGLSKIKFRALRRLFEESTSAVAVHLRSERAG
jgi:hypothetical protein